jgi:hypothetical protein
MDSGTTEALSGVWGAPSGEVFAVGGSAAGRILRYTRPAPSVAVQSPNGGQRWKRGTMQTISWAGTLGAGTVSVRLRKGGVFRKVVAASAPVGGSISWKVPRSLPPGRDYRIRVRWNADPAVSDDSDRPFTIY